MWYPFTIGTRKGAVREAGVVLGNLLRRLAAAAIPVELISAMLVLIQLAAALRGGGRRVGPDGVHLLADDGIAVVAER